MSIDEPQPAAKRRRLTDTIVSTLTTVALVGAAVGITAYRLWRDMGRPAEEEIAAAPSQMEQPPPYTEQAFIGMDKHMTTPQPRQIQPVQPVQHEFIPARTTLAVSAPALKPRRSIGTTRRKVSATNRPRRKTFHYTPSHTQHSAAAPTFDHLASSSSSHTPMPDEIEDDDAIDDQMDWMGAQLRSLIEEGKRALGKEVVLSTEGIDDEETSAIDDGHEGWEEDEPSFGSMRLKHKRSGSRRRPSTINTSNPYSPTSSTLTSPKRSGHSRGSSRSGVPSPGIVSPRLGPPPHMQEEQVKVLFEPGSFSRQNSLRRDADDTASKELRESMDRVRRAYGIQR